MQLPFAMIPLIHFTSDRRRMGAFANKLWVQVLAWITAAVIVGLNVRLVIASSRRLAGHRRRPALARLARSLLRWRRCSGSAGLGNRGADV